MKKEIDKKSVEYFMNKMTQKEFDQLRNGRPIIPYEFNKVNTPSAEKWVTLSLNKKN